MNIPERRRPGCDSHVRARVSSRSAGSQPLCPRRRPSRLRSWWEGGHSTKTHCLPALPPKGVHPGPDGDHRTLDRHPQLDTRWHRSDIAVHRWHVAEKARGRLLVAFVGVGGEPGPLPVGAGSRYRLRRPALLRRSHPRYVRTSSRWPCLVPLDFSAGLPARRSCPPAPTRLAVNLRPLTAHIQHAL